MSNIQQHSQSDQFRVHIEMPPSEARALVAGLISNGWHNIKCDQTSAAIKLLDRAPKFLITANKDKGQTYE